MSGQAGGGFNAVSSCRPSGRALRSALLASTALVGVGPALAQNLPTGGQVAAGSVSIGRPSGGALAIQQNSQNAVVNWQGFSIARQNQVNIAQPNSGAALLNRVTGSTPSTIAGQLNANGQVYLVNPNGIAITKTGKVNAGAFVASTLDISDRNFMAGKRTFTGNGSSARVVNRGAISVGRGGYAALMGGEVRNSGTITAPLGKVGLGSGERQTLDLSGDGFLQVAVPTGGKGKGALIRHSGLISAEGGQVEIRAAAARGMARAAVNLSGAVEARSVSGRNGSILLSGGDGSVNVGRTARLDASGAGSLPGGRVRVSGRNVNLAGQVNVSGSSGGRVRLKAAERVQFSGRIDATGRLGRGGRVAVTGRDINFRAAEINASGRVGGGSVKVGGGRQGSGRLPHAETVRIDDASVIRADATGQGNGGEVVVWSDKFTSFSGLITARGGPNGGDGGEAEVSSKGVLAYGGLAVLTAAKGRAGTLLLDPYDITISDGPDANGFFLSGSYAVFGTSTINTTTLQNQLANGNVIVSTGPAGPFGGTDQGNITVAAPFGWSATTILTLTAANAIAVNAPISINGGGQLTLNTGTATLGSSTQPLLSFGPGGSVTYAAGSGSGIAGQALTINGASYTLVYNMAQLDAIDGREAVGGTSVTGYGPGLGGLYALAGGLNASGTTYTDAIVAGQNGAQTFTGTLEGLGHTITGLTIASSNDYVGLIGTLGPGGAARDLGLIGGSVAGGSSVGGLAGYNQGTITQAYATSSVSGQYEVGGLVGNNRGTVTQVYAAGDVSGFQHVGGLVGENFGTIAQAHTTGSVSGDTRVGGLVGFNFGGTIQQAYATSSVSGSVQVGGLVGYNYGNAISEAYATGAVSGSRYVGGLVGYNTGTISQAYAVGAVSGSVAVGGIVGTNQGGTISQAYWDIQTSGRETGIGQDTNNQSGVTGLTTAQLQGFERLSGGTFFSTAAQLGDGTSSAFSGGANGLYPYLTSFFPNGVQAVSGTAYADAGLNPAASGAAGAVTVTLDAAGGRIGQATTGANGYYYVFTGAGTLGSGTNLLVTTPTNSATGAKGGATLATASSTISDPVQTGLDLYGGALTAPTNASTLSGAPSRASLLAAATAAAGSDAAAAAVVASTTGTGYLASGALTIDQPVSTGSTFLVKTGSGGALTVAQPITIADGGSLGLYSGGTLRLNAPLTAQGAVGVGLGYEDASPTNLSFAQGASLTYTKADGTPATDAVPGQALRINGQSYTLIYNMAQLDSIDGVEAVGGTRVTPYGPPFVAAHALAGNLDASGTTYTDAIVAGQNGGASYSGTLEGLGHTITGLTISSSNDYVGLIGNLDTFGTVRDIGLVGGSVAGRDYVGGLVGRSNYNGAVTQAYATGSVLGRDSVGGLVGLNNGTISQAYATGGVSGSDGLGGLVGFNGGTISQAYATGAVSGQSSVGGLVGLNNGTITQAYAAGAVSGSNLVGGLVGYNFYGDISQAYAVGAVSGSVAVGGIVGTNQGGTISQAYWDTQTSGLANGIGQDTNNQSGVTGLTTAQLQGLDPVSGSTFFSTVTNLGDGTSSAFSGGANGLYPYLTNFFPNGVQAVSGTAYADAGLNPAASGAAGAVTVTLDAGGSRIGQATTGANGYYYVFTGAGTLGSGTNLLVTTPTNSATGAKGGATLATASSTISDPVQTGLDLYGGALTAPTNASTLSGAPSRASLLAAATAAAGSDSAAAAVVASTTGTGYIASGAFTIDQAVSTGSTFLVKTGSGDALTVAQPITIADGGSLGLYSGGTLRLNAPLTAQGAVGVGLGYEDASPTNLSFAQGASLTYTKADGTPATDAVPGQALRINGQSYTLIYNMAQLDSIDGVEAVGGTGVTRYGPLFATYALAGNLDASGTTYTDAIVTGQGGAPSFNGTLEGLGHTITGLTISSTNDYVGLIGKLDAFGTVRDLGLVGGSVAGRDYVGGLAGYNQGTIALSYAGGAVSGSQFVGGLVGINQGTIAQTYATGAVSGVSQVGGLVGGNPFGTITQAYATGAVSGFSYVGGLVGSNVGEGRSCSSCLISQAYATGSVSGAYYVGGLVGGNSGRISQAYWDTQTSGQAGGIGRDTNNKSGNVTGLTTRQLQGSDPVSGSTFSTLSNLGDGTSSAFAGGENRLYPYLTSFFPNGVQAVSGFAYKSAGNSSPLASTAPTITNGVLSGGPAYVGVLADGQSFGSGPVTTGANGYYYAFAATGTIPASGGNVVAVTLPNAATGARAGASLVTAATAAPVLAGLDVHGDWVSVQADAGKTSLSAVSAAAFAAAGATIAPQLATVPNLQLRLAAPSFTLDQNLTVSGTLALGSAGAVSQTAGTALSSAGLLLTGGGSFALTGANTVSTLAGQVGSSALNNAASLTIGSAGDASGATVAGVSGTGNITLSAAGNLTLASGAPVTGASPVLAATGAFVNNAGANAVTATSGRWLVYSANPSGDTFGGLDSGNTAVWGTAPGGAVTPSGNRYVFAYQPVLSVASTSLTKIYGEDAAASVGAAYTIAGFQPGVAGAFLGDTAATAFTGAPAVTSAGSPATADVAGSPYLITAGRGSLASPSGYGFSFLNAGTLTVTAAAVTTGPGPTGAPGPGPTVTTDPGPTGPTVTTGPGPTGAPGPGPTDTPGPSSTGPIGPSSTVTTGPGPTDTLGSSPTGTIGSSPTGTPGPGPTGTIEPSSTGTIERGPTGAPAPRATGTPEPGPAGTISAGTAGAGTGGALPRLLSSADIDDASEQARRLGAPSTQSPTERSDDLLPKDPRSTDVFVCAEPDTTQPCLAPGRRTLSGTGSH